MKKVAIYGGAFNPITKGHLHVIRSLRKALPDFQIWVSPTYESTWDKEMLNPKERLEMCKLALKNFPDVELSGYEIHNKISGTLKFYKTLRIDPKYSNYEFYFVIGMDQANNIEKWVDSPILMNTVRFIVLPRAGEKEPTDPWYRNNRHIFIDKDDQKKRSSTEVRENVNNYYKGNFSMEANLKRDLTPEVLKYILTNRLYEKR